MIEWLRTEKVPPSVDLGGRRLPVELNRHPRARRLTMRLAPDGSAVRITLPHWCRSEDAVSFALARRNWLEAQLDKLPAPGNPVVRGTFRYRGSDIAIDWRLEAPRQAELVTGRLIIGGPRETLIRRLQRWLEGEAEKLLSDDLAYYCKVATVALPKLRLTRAGRRWGSCSTMGIVRINWRLVMAPDFVRRSVVAHEAAHLVHFDHSPAFHTLLARLYEGNVAIADAWLRENGRSLYADFG